MLQQGMRQSPSEKAAVGQRGLVALFRTLVATTTFAFLLAAFSPLLNWAVVWPEISDVLRHDGSMAVLRLPSYVTGLLVLLWVAAAVGVWQFDRHARLAFLLLTAISVVLTGLGGISVQLPFEVMLEYAVALMDGAILAIAYLSPLKEKFLNKGVAD